MFQYKRIIPQQSNPQKVDVSMNRANGHLTNTLMSLKSQNTVLEKNVSTLQVLLDSLLLKKDEGNPELVEDIMWNHYYYKKYQYETHIMLVIIGLCILLNILASFTDPTIFPAVAGFILSIAFVYIVYCLWDLGNRDDQNFDEYNFSEYTKGHPKANQYTTGKSKYSTDIDISNCVVRDEKDSYKKL